MSTGTKMVQLALSLIGAHSPIKPAGPESIETGKDMLNSMISRWIDDGINTGMVPLKAVGDELSEPLSLTNTVASNLALELHPLFPASQVSPALRVNANKTYNDMLNKYQAITIPEPQVRETLPVGQGNRDHSFFDKTFFDRGDEIG